MRASAATLVDALARMERAVPALRGPIERRCHVRRAIALAILRDALGWVLIDRGASVSVTNARKRRGGGNVRILGRICRHLEQLLDPGFVRELVRGTGRVCTTS